MYLSGHFRADNNSVRKTTAALIVIGLVWVTYTAGPLASDISLSTVATRISNAAVASQQSLFSLRFWPSVFNEA
jgi:hypothetical protein